MVLAPLLTSVIIDDELLAQNLLRKYVGRLPFLAPPVVFDSAVAALGHLPQLRPDLLLLDVNMPQLSGLDLLRGLPSPRPAVVLTTAYAEYAVQGFDGDAVDFLLKPFSFERFTKAITKVQAYLGSQSPPAAPVPATPQVLLLKEHKKVWRVPAADILLVEGMKDYVKVYTRTQVILTHVTMTRIASLLAEAAFLRVNKSYMVHQGAIVALDGNMLELVNGLQVPIGISYRQAVREQLTGGLL